MTMPCSGCIHYQVTFGSLHPVEKWCLISGEALSCQDVWHNKPKACTSKFNWGDGPLMVHTENVPECKFTMTHEEAAELGHWYASKLTNFYRENRGTYYGFHSFKSNQFWLDTYYDQNEVELENSKRFWPKYSVDSKGKLVVIK